MSVWTFFDLKWAKILNSFSFVNGSLLTAFRKLGIDFLDIFSLFEPFKRDFTRSIVIDPWPPQIDALQAFGRYFFIYRKTEAFFWAGITNQTPSFVTFIDVLDIEAKWVVQWYLETVLVVDLIEFLIEAARVFLYNLQIVLDAVADDRL